MSISVKTVVGINKNSFLLWNLLIFTLFCKNEEYRANSKSVSDTNPIHKINNYDYKTFFANHFRISITSHLFSGPFDAMRHITWSQKSRPIGKCFSR